MKSIARLSMMILTVMAMVVAIGCSNKGANKISSDTLSSSIDEINKIIELRYINPDVGQKIIDELNNKRQNLIELKNTEKFKEAVDEIMQSFDKHLFIDDDPEQVALLRDMVANPVKIKEYEKKLEQFEAEKNFGFGKTEMIENKIGYMKINHLCKSPEAMDKAVELINSLNGSEIFIIDLRDCLGGHSLMVQYISSYFLEDSIHLNTIYNRSENTRVEYWTKKVPGVSFVGTPLYILTNNATFSAAEEFAYNMKSLGRATIVGEKTKGGAHPTDRFAVNDYFFIAVSTQKAIKSHHTDKLEGTGITPDIEVSSDKAFDKAVELAKGQLAI